MRCLILSGFIAVFLFGAAGCGVNETYIKGSMAMYKAIAPEYLEYVKADPKKTDEEKARRERTVQAWDAMNKEWAETEGVD